MNAQREQWLSEAIDLIPPQYGREEWREYLLPSLKRCHSRSRHLFWAYLRLTLAKSSDTAWLLEYVQESKLLPEPVPQPKSDGFEYAVSADGTVALIPVGDGDAHGIWRIGIEHLAWARSMMPVFLKRLPDLEPAEVARQRQIRHQSRYMKAKLSVEQLQSFERELADLDEQVARLYPPVPRYELMKWTTRQDIAVHRLFVAADEDVEVEAINGDFLDFTTTKIKVTLEPVADEDGVAGGRGEAETRIVEVSNLQIVPRSEEQQTRFEKGFLGYKITPQGDISTTPLRVMANADLGKRTWNGDTGRIEDCGKHSPTTPSEQYAPERFTAKLPRPTLNPDAIRRRWRGF